MVIQIRQSDRPSLSCGVGIVAGALIAKETMVGMQLRDQMVVDAASFKRFKTSFLALLEESNANADGLGRRIAHRVLTGFKLSSRGIPNSDFQEFKLGFK